MKQDSTPVRIFVVEDDPMYQKMVRYLMEMNPDHEVHCFTSGQECIENLYLQPDIISLDYSLPDMTGAEVLSKIKTFNKDIDVIILSSQQDVSTAVTLLRKGVYDYLTKDSETKERLLHILQRLNQQQTLRQEVQELRTALQSNYSFQKNIIGTSPIMKKVFKMMEKAVRTNITVSITGATGTGKEVVAKGIHYNSSRKAEAFVAVNMSAIPKDLLESELFGYEKGAFTGATTRKPGRFELAHRGTLFLDEIAEMDIKLQAKVLRAVQEREITRVGGTKPVKFDARIITATHRDLVEEVRQGRFREDLYYRLLGLPIQLPNLAERGNDILIMARHFLDHFTEQNNLPQLELSKKAKDKLLKYRFPGNVRELKAVIELAAVLHEGGRIGADDIRFKAINRPLKEGLLAGEKSFEEYKHQIIHHYLQKYNNDIGIVASKLDIGKSTIYRLLKNESKDSTLSIVP